MPTAFNGFNIGADVAVTIADQSGDILGFDELGYATEIQVQASDVVLRVNPITGGGAPIYQRVPNGFAGMVRFNRQNAALEQLMADLDTAWYGSGSIEQFTMTWTIANRNGTSDSMLYLAGQFHEFNLGSFQGLREVTQSARFMFSRRQSSNPTSILSSLLAA